MLSSTLNESLRSTPKGTPQRLLGELSCAAVAVCQVDASQHDEDWTRNASKVCSGSGRNRRTDR